MNTESLALDFKSATLYAIRVVLHSADPERLTAALAKRQGPNGEWVNPTDLFMEGDANLVTAYGILALASTRKKAA